MIATRPLSCEVLTGMSDAEAFAPQWHDLLVASGMPDVCLDPTWALTWFRHYGRNRELRLAVFRERGALVGIAPMCLETKKPLPGLPQRRLQFLGCTAGEPDGLFMRELCPISLPGHEGHVTAALLDAIAENRLGPWDECLFEMYDRDAPWAHRLLSGCAERRIAHECVETAAAPYLPLPDDFDAYVRSLRKSDRIYFTQSMRYFAEYAEQSGLQRHLARDPATLEQGFKALVDLHEMRWQGEGGGAFSRPRFLAFYTESSQQLLAQNLLDLRWYSVAGKPVAASYVVTSGGRLRLLQLGRDLDAPSRASVGANLIIEVIRDGIAAGMKEFDFMCGTQKYKLRFTDRSRKLVDIRAFRTPIHFAVRRAFKAARSAAARTLRAAQRPGDGAAAARD